MSKLLTALTMLIIGIAVGAGTVFWYSQHEMDMTMPEQSKAMVNETKPLFYRNPMNPEITSPVPAKDYMGMDYIPVYAEQPQQQTVSPAEVLFYRNPMNPAITSPVPAQDEMGMDYIPVYAEEMDAGNAPVGTVKIDPVTVQNIGVRTATARIQTLSHHIRTVGKITYDEERISKLHPKTEGWIEKLFIDKTGTQVKKNTMLLSIYSPQLVTSAQEYLLALKSVETLKDSPFKDIRDSTKQMTITARERLELLDVPEHQIRDMEQTGNIQKALHIHSPFAGTVINIGAREGQYVTPQTELYMLADLTKVWVIAQVYESDLPWVQVGDPVEMQLTAMPDKIFKGHLSYIYPYAESKTRSIKVRLVFDNPDLLLKPDMFANITIKAQQQENVITVPSESVIRSGENEQLFIVRDSGKYEPRSVRTGLTANGMTQILTGLEAGEQVVTSSQFLIDSESKLRESTAKMLEAQQAESGSDMLMQEQFETETAPPIDMNMQMEQEQHQHD